MKITINTNILKRHNMSLGEFLVMLLGYYDIDISNSHDSIIRKHLAQKNLFKDYEVVLSNNSKNLIAQILIESDDAVVKSNIDFDNLAHQLMEVFPDGIKPGKTYPWRGSINEITLKLKTLVAKYNFRFTSDEAIQATKEYVDSFTAPFQHMHTLKNFILYTSKNSQGQYEMESLFMTTIENNRK